MILFKDVTFIYDGKPLMTHFSDEVSSGEKVVVYGASGTGKSTLLSSIAGLVQPDEGEIWVGGQLLTGTTVSDIRRLIAWVPQEFTLPYDTVKECVFAPFKLRQNRNKIPAKQTVLNIFGHLGLEQEIYTKHLVEISGGQRQRVMIAIAVLLDKPLLLLDEPTSALDSDSIEKLIVFLKSYKSMTMVAVSHDERFIRAFDRSIKIGEER